MNKLENYFIAFGVIFGALFYLLFYSNILVNNFEIYIPIFLEVLLLLMFAVAGAASFFVLFLPVRVVVEKSKTNWGKIVSIFVIISLLSSFLCIIFSVIGFLFYDLSNNIFLIKCDILWVILSLGLVIFYLQAVKMQKIKIVKLPTEWIFLKPAIGGFFML